MKRFTKTKNMSEILELHQLVESDAGSHQIRRSKAYELLQNCIPFLGILLATLSSFFFSLCSVIVKQLVDINPIELASVRYVVEESLRYLELNVDFSKT